MNRNKKKKEKISVIGSGWGRCGRGDAGELMKRTLWHNLCSSAEGTCRSVCEAFKSYNRTERRLSARLKNG